MSTNELAEDYQKELKDLHFNSKPLITMLTMLADENKEHASVISQVLLSHIKKTKFKLPAMYLVDSIVKNVGDEYKRLIGNSIGSVFSGAFKEVDEKTRKKLYELRQTWNEVFPQSRLFLLDTSVKEIDPAWPMLSQPRIGNKPQTIHVNPNKFMSHTMTPGMTTTSSASSSLNSAPSASYSPNVQAVEELKRLQSEKRALEETRKKVEKMMKTKDTKTIPAEPSAKLVESSHSLTHLDRQSLLSKYKIKKKSQPTDSLTVKPADKAPNIYVAPWKAKDLSILPGMASNKSLSTTSRDQELISDSVKTSKSTPKDPRLTSTNSLQSVPQTTKDVESRVSSSSVQQEPTKCVVRDPRLSSKSPVKINPVTPSQIPQKSSKDNRLKRSDSKENDKDKRKSEKEHKSKSQKTEKTEKVPPKTKEPLPAKEKEKKHKHKHKCSKNEKESPNSKEDPSPPKEKEKKHKHKDKEKDSVTKAKSEVVNLAESTSKEEVQPVIKPPVDTDLRQLFKPVMEANKTKPTDAKQPEKMETSQAKDDQNTNLSLFGKEDVDLRLLPMASRFPPHQTRSEISNPFLGKPDEDMRIPRAKEGQENKDPRYTSPLDVVNENDLDTDAKSKKTTFNSPHAAKWEKFRENNPEFKEYERQASVSEDGTYTGYPDAPSVRGAKSAVHARQSEGEWRRPQDSSPGWYRGRGRGGHSSSQNFRPGVIGSHGRAEEQWTGEPDLSSMSEEVLRAVCRESETRTIDIDGKPREIRTYGGRSVILLDWSDPRLISFENVQCNIVFDEGKFVLPIYIEDKEKEFHIDGETHRVKLGVPTRELIIDGKGYQCFFGGKPITVFLAGKNRTVSLDGRPPRVDISPVQHLDYLLGKIELVVNDRKIIHLYLDAKPQRFSIDGKAFVIKFTDKFNSVIINDVKFPVEFGGHPISISVRGYRQFLRFSSLPSHVLPGQTSVKGMDRDDNILIPTYNSSPSPPSEISTSVPPPPYGARAAPDVPLGVRPEVPVSTNFPSGPNPEYPSNSPFRYPSQSGTALPFGVIPSGTRPPLGVIPGAYSTSTGIPPLPTTILPPGAVVPPSAADMSVPPPMIPILTKPPSIDVHSLLDRLMKTGIIGGDQKKDDKSESKKDKETKDKTNKEAEEDEDIDDLKGLPPSDVMFNLENLRKRNQKLIKRMYRGMQCSSCGLRYPPDQSELYSQHLDWHFRMNKKQQDSTKKVSTRRFHHCFDDWVQYEEIEEADVRIPSMFEMEGQSTRKNSETDNDDSEEEIPSVPVSTTDSSLGVCPVCHETFDQFYHQGTEAWHYKYACQFDGSNYHPGCHQDLLKAQKLEEERVQKESEEAAKKAEGSTYDDNDDDIIIEEFPIVVKEDKKKANKGEKEIAEDKEDKKKENKGEKEIEVEKEDEKKKNKGEKEIVEEEKGDKKKDNKGENEIEELVEINNADEEIQEIEKVIDNTPKEEIDLTADDDKDENKTEEEEEETEEVRKEKRRKRIMARNRESISSLPVPTTEVRMKEEPMETDEDCRIFICPAPPPLLADIPIKMEIEDEDDSMVVVDDILEAEVVATSSWLAPEPTSTAATDIASSIDGNSELVSRPQTSQPTSGAPKIRINFSLSSSSLQNNTELVNDNHNSTETPTENNNNNNNSEKTMNGFDEFVPPPFTVDYNIKPSFKGAQLQDLPTVHRGMEMSSLCSIM